MKTLMLILSALFISAFPLLGLLESKAQSPLPGPVAVKSNIIANNTTAIVIKSTGGTVYAIEASNNSTTLAYIKMYNTATATCGSGTPYARYMIPASATVMLVHNTSGDAYVNGINMCVTTGIADNDTGAPTADRYVVNVHYR